MTDSSKGLLGVFVLAVAFFVAAAGWACYKTNTQDKDFKSILGVDASLDVRVRQQQIPLIVVRVGQLREKADASWNALRNIRQEEKNLVILPSSSDADAEKASSLVGAVQTMEDVHQKDFSSLVDACHYLKMGPGVEFPYPPAAYAGCP